MKLMTLILALRLLSYNHLSQLIVWLDLYPAQLPRALCFIWWLESTNMDQRL